MQPVVHGLCHMLFQLAQGELVLSGHGGNLLFQGLVLCLHDKVGHDEVLPHNGSCLTEESTHFLRLTQTATAIKRHLKLLLFPAVTFWLSGRKHMQAPGPGQCSGPGENILLQRLRTRPQGMSGTKAYLMPISSSVR